MNNIYNIFELIYKIINDNDKNQMNKQKIYLKEKKGKEKKMNKWPHS